MTCIVGIAENGTVYMGGDSASVYGWTDNKIGFPKVFIKRQDFLIGYTGSFRMGQLIQYTFEPPKNKRSNSMAYLVNDFVPELRECLKEGGFTIVDNNKESNGSFLIGYRGRLFRVQSDNSILESIEGYDVIGDDEYALGSLFSTDGMSPKDRIMIALEASARFSTVVSEPFHLLELSDKK